VNVFRREKHAAASAAVLTVRIRKVEGVIFIILGKLNLRTKIKYCIKTFSSILLLK